MDAEGSSSVTLVGPGSGSNTGSNNGSFASSRSNSRAISNSGNSPTAPNGVPSRDYDADVSGSGSQASTGALELYATLNGSNLGSIPEYSEAHEEDPVAYPKLLEEVVYPDLGSQADQDDDDIEIEQPKVDAKGKEDDHYLSEDSMEGIENGDI